MLLKLDIRDESAVRLFSEQLVSFINVQGIVALLINHSIAQRMAAMHNEAGKSSR